MLKKQLKRPKGVLLTLLLSTQVLRPAITWIPRPEIYKTSKIMLIKQMQNQVRFNSHSHLLRLSKQSVFLMRSRTSNSTLLEAPNKRLLLKVSINKETSTGIQIRNRTLSIWIEMPWMQPEFAFRPQKAMTLKQMLSLMRLAKKLRRLEGHINSPRKPIPMRSDLLASSRPTVASLPTPFLITTSACQEPALFSTMGSTIALPLTTASITDSPLTMASTADSPLTMAWLPLITASLLARLALVTL